MNKGIFSGCGNNFYICYYYNIKVEDIISICNTYHTDGFIMLEQIDSFRMHFYNQDGSRAPMCGNGIRCLTYFMYLNNLVEPYKNIPIITDSGIVNVSITNINPMTVKVNLGKPSFRKEDMDCLDIYINKIIEINNISIPITNVFLGTHHTIIFDETMKKYAKEIQNNSIFKKGTNVDFVKVLNKNNIHVDTYERGVGWTNACGTGAASSFVVANTLGLVNNNITVHFKNESVHVKEVNNEIYLEGPCVLDLKLE